MLPFQREILQSLYPDNPLEPSDADSLTVLGQGLGLQQLLGYMLDMHDDPRNLVLLLNVSQEEFDIIQKYSQAAHVVSITADTPAKDRLGIYTQGGIVRITSRILVVDMLNKVVPIHLVSGIIVLHAENVAESSSEAFILRLYREENKAGFIKAFSDRPESLVNGIGKLERLCKSLLVRNVHAWPRFHIHVSESINVQVDLIELRVAMTSKMYDIQSLLLECLGACLSEIKKSSLLVSVINQADLDEAKLENAFFSSFETLVNQQLEGSWHNVSAKTRQTIKDVGILKQLLYYLLSYDCVSFNIFLETILASNAMDSKSFFKIDQGPSGWLLLDEADLLFESSRSRVYNKTSVSKKIEPVLEEQPKFKALVQSLVEIDQARQEDENGACINLVLVVAYGYRTCRELERLVAKLDPSPPYSCTGSKEILLNSFTNYLHLKKTMLSSADNLNAVKQISAQNQPFAKRRRIRKIVDTSDSLDSFDIDEAFLSSLVVPEAPAGEMTDKHIHVRSYSSHQPGSYSDNGDDILLLTDLMPKWVIMYDANPTFVRCLEVFKAQYPENPLTVYFMVYDDSVEEQVYLSAIRREKSAFERLISLKSTLVIPLDQDGRVLLDAEDLFWNTGGRINSTVLVDMREFRSKLPFALHAARMNVVPCTLTVGDYIISPKTCVERKSMADLAQSLKSGRLHSQCKAMTANYDTSVLLVEREQNLRKTGQMLYDSEVDQKLALLVIHFPMLRIIWTSTPKESAQVIQGLKQLEEEPDMETAISIGAELGTVGEYNVEPLEMLLGMPGISFNNHHLITSKLKNLSELCAATRDEVVDILGPENGRKLYRFLHEKQNLDGKKE